MAKQLLAPAGLRKPAGPFSAGISTPSGRMVFVAGQVAVDGNGNTVGVGDLGAQTRQVLQNIGQVLAAGGATFDDVVKVTVFVTDLEHLAELEPFGVDEAIVGKALYENRFTFADAVRAAEGRG